MDKSFCYKSDFIIGEGLRMSSIISTKTNFSKGNIRILSVDFETRQVSRKVRIIITL